MPVPPTTIEPARIESLFQDYGFEQNDSEAFVPILRLIKTGAYKIEEEHIYDHSNDGKKSDTAFIRYEIYRKEDSVFIERYKSYRSGTVDSLITIYDGNGKELWSGAMRARNHLPRLHFGNGLMSIDSAHVHCALSRHHPIDSIVPWKVTTYDKFGRPLIHNVYDIYSWTGNYSRVREKTIYRYLDSKNKSESEQQNYVAIQLPSPDISAEDRKDSTSLARYRIAFQEFEEEEKSAEVQYTLKWKINEVIDSSARVIATERYDYGHDTLHYNWYFDAARYDKNWHLLQESSRTKYMYGGETSEEQLKYLRNSEGLLLTRIRTANGLENEPQTWSYDNNGNCTSHRRGETLEKWTYDSQGNLTEYDSGNNQKNKFKIYYK